MTSEIVTLDLCCSGGGVCHMDNEQYALKRAEKHFRIEKCYNLM